MDRFGHVLRSLGIRREERILLALLDTIDWPTAFLGAIKAGVVPIPVSTLMTEEDYRGWRESADADESQRVDRMSAFVQNEYVSGVYEVVDELEG